MSHQANDEWAEQKAELAAEPRYTQIKIKVAYREKLAKLASSQSRSMANMVEVLIDQATDLSDEHNTKAEASPNLTQRKGI